MRPTPPANAAANDRDLKIGEIEHNISRAMARHMPDFHFDAQQQLQTLPTLDPVIDLDRLKLEPYWAWLNVHFAGWFGKHHSVVFMTVDRGYPLCWRQPSRM